MPYVGSISGGTGTIAVSANYKFASKFTAPSAFSATVMGIRAETAFAAGEYIKLGIYSDSAGSPNALLGQTEAVEGNGTDRWYHATLDSPVNIANGTPYWLAFIADSEIVVWKDAIANAGEYNVDTYADGFSDPFGSPSTTSSELKIYAASGGFLLGGGDLSKGGAVVESSGGTKYAIFEDGNSLEIWKNIDGTPALADSDTAATIFGGGNIAWIHAAIDGAGTELIHLICACDSEQTRDVAYATFNTSTDTIGAWEEAADYTEQAPVNSGVSISLDGNDKPHILFVDAVKIQGSTQDNVYYTEKTGVNWAGATQIGARGTKTDAYDHPTITLRNNDDIEAFYYLRSPQFDPCYNTYTGGAWSGESQYEESSATIGFGGVTATAGGTVYRYHADAAEDIEENNVDTVYNADATSNRISAALDGTDRYIFYIDTGDDVHLISNDGGGWTDEGDLQVGTYAYVIAEWAYNNENQSGEINYIFDDGTNVYYDSFVLAGPITVVMDALTLAGSPEYVTRVRPVLADDLTLAGSAPTVQANYAAIIDALTLAGSAEHATRVRPVLADPLTLAGSAETIQTNYAAIFDVLTLAGSAETIQTNYVALIDALTLAGSAEDVTRVRPVLADALTLAGSPPTIQTNYVALIDALTLAGSPPSIQTNYAVLIDVLTLAGSAEYVTRIRPVLMDILSLVGSAQTIGVSLPIIMDALSLVGSPGGILVIRPVMMDALTLAGSAQALQINYAALFDALTLVGSAETLQINYEAVLDALTLAGSAEYATRVRPVIADVLSLASSVPNIQINYEAILGALTLASSAQILQDVWVAHLLDALGLASSAETASIWRALPMDALTLAGSAESLSVWAARLMDSLSLVSLPETLKVIRPVMMDAMTLASSVLQLTVATGIIMDPLTLASAAQSLLIIRPVVMDGLTLVSSPQYVTRVRPVMMSDLSLASSVQALQINYAALLSGLTLASSPQGLLVWRPQLMNSLSLVGGILSASVVPGAVALPMSEVVLAAVLQALLVFPGGVVTKGDLVLGAQLLTSLILGKSVKTEVGLDAETVWKVTLGKG